MSIIPIPYLKPRLFKKSLTVMRLWSSSFHTIAGISFAGNIHCLFRNEPGTTQWNQLHWIQMHKQKLFAHLPCPELAHKTQKAPSK
jgi:hypothetical protein